MSSRMTSVPVLTIDGPSGSGKGTVARRLANQLGWHLLDSGALYRLTAVAAQQRGLEAAVPEHQVRAAELARHLDVQFTIGAQGGECILLEGRDVTTEVRAETTGSRASFWAALPPVRAALLDLQRGFRRAPGLIADGRDMGTVVFTDAPLKIFLDASAAERARRRYKQLSELGIPANIDSLCREIEARDARDRERAASPLVPAVDAVVLDSSHLNIEQVVERIRGLAHERRLLTR